VEKEARAVGAMTATIRQVTMPPGSRIVKTDRYPTLRMITSGEMKWGSIPPGSDVSGNPEHMFKKGEFDWITWTNYGQGVLANESDKLATFLEWSVEPAPAGSVLGP
jgi:hypothetical protein